MIHIIEWDDEGNIIVVRDILKIVLSDTARLFPNNNWMLADNNITSVDHYVKDGVVRNKETQQTTLVNGVLSNYPVNSVLYINNESFILNEDFVDIELPYKDKWVIIVRCIGFYDFEEIYEN